MIPADAVPFTIPLDKVPQTFAITLGSVEYNMTVRWNDADEAGWIIDLSDVNTGVPIVNNIPMVTGVDLLSGLEYLGINGQLWVYTAGDTFAVPTLDNLGSESNLYFLTEDVNGQ